jgi:hypothetical protein
MRRLVLLAAAAAVAALGATAAATAPASSSSPAGHRLAPLVQTALGNHAVCRPQRRGEACVTRTDDGVTGTRNRLYFRNGIRAYGGYWTIQHGGGGASTVGDHWPFKYTWADSKWFGHVVVQIATYTFGNQYAAGANCGGVHISVCLKNKDGSSLWVEYASRSGGKIYWHFVSVEATDRIYELVGKRNSYLLTSNGVDRIAIVTINGSAGARQSFTLPRV